MSRKVRTRLMLVLSSVVLICGVVLYDVLGDENPLSLGFVAACFTVGAGQSLAAVAGYMWGKNESE